MQLPKFNFGAPKESPNGANPNDAKRTPTPSAFSQAASTIANTVTDQISPTNFIRQGTYNAFGNNGFTRTGVNLVDSAANAFSNLFKDPGADDTTTDKLAKEQIKLLKANNEVLQDILKAQKIRTPNPEEDLHDFSQAQNEYKRKNFQNKEDVDLQKITSSMVPVGGLEQIDHEEFSLLESISKNVIEIKSILTDGFSNIETALTETFSPSGKRNKKRKNTKIDDVEDAKIISESQFKNGRNWSKREAHPTVLEKYVITSNKFLRQIANGVNKVIAILGDKPLSDVENSTEEKRNKHMGMAQEIGNTQISSDSSKNPLQLPSDVSSWSGKIMAAILVVVDLIVSNIESIGAKIKEIFSKSLTWLKGKGADLWEGTKNLADDALKFLKGKGSQALELGRDALKTVGEKVVGPGKELAEKYGKKIAKGGVKAIPFIGEAAMVGFAGYDAFNGYKDEETKKNLDINGRDPTTGEKIKSATGNVVEGLSFGLIDSKKTSKFLDSIFSAKENTEKKLADIQEKSPSKSFSEIANPQSNGNVNIGNIDNSSESYFSTKQSTRNSDDSFNRYLDKHYSF